MTTILLTNDDGLWSPGLVALRRVVASLGTVVTVAPDHNYSAVARGITIDRPLHIQPATFGDGFRGYAVDGTPVDCVRLALLGLAGPRPDFVVAGINLGANMGDDVTYSGTVAAALEAVLLNVPAVAVSVASREPRYLSETAGLIVPFLDRALAGGLPPRTLINLNLPDVPRSDVQGARLTRLGRASYHDQVIVMSDGGRPATYSMRALKNGGDAPDEAGTDFAAVREGYLSLTPLLFDFGGDRGARALGDWDLDGLFGRATAAVS